MVIIISFLERSKLVVFLHGNRFTLLTIHLTDVLRGRRNETLLLHHLKHW